MLVTLGLAAAPSPAEAATTVVKVGQLNGGTSPAQQYNLASISVVRGDTVRWEWFDGAHDIQSANAPGLSSGPRGGFNSLGQVYQYTFNTAGTYTYYCDEHAGPGDAGLAVIDQSLADGKMVGKVVVTAPVADTLAPAVSAAAAAPNPTAGSGGVTLTATVTDTAPAGATAARGAGAEWSRGASAAAAGNGTAMVASDAAFNSATEGVTANVTISEAAGTSVTLWVRGRDAAGLWSTAVSTTVSVTAPPAGAVQATVTLSGGSLGNVAQSIAFPGVSATGLDQTVAGSTLTWQAKDARGTAAGWNVTVTSSNFTGTAGSIVVDNFKVQLTAVTTVAGNTPPAASPASYVALSVATPLKLLSAALNTGMGTYDYTPQFQLTVPASAVVGSYTVNVTVSVNSGPP